MEPRHFFKDWGVWGWLWALGWFGFILGLLLAPASWGGLLSPGLLLLPALGAFLMRASERQAQASFR
ncbi:MAG: hypothetical protein ACE5LS_05600 [Thermoplasmata archaeon]